PCRSQSMGHKYATALLRRHARESARRARGGRGLEGDSALLLVNGAPISATTGALKVSLILTYDRNSAQDGGRCYEGGIGGHGHAAAGAVSPPARLIQLSGRRLRGQPARMVGAWVGLSGRCG